jgi:hypothetical protein
VWMCQKDATSLACIVHNSNRLALADRDLVAATLPRGIESKRIK